MRPKQKVKLKDVADKLGVSVVTVSNSLAGRPGVSNELRTKIRECAISLGLDTSKYLRSAENSNIPVPSESLTIGVLVSERYIAVGSSFYWELYQKVAYAASEKNCFSSLVIIKDRDENVAIPDNKGIDGYIVIGSFRGKFLQSFLFSTKVPVVFVDQQIDDDGYSSVLSGNYYGMYRATRELVKAGHRDIGFVGALNYSRNIIDRYYGYKKCMRENGLKVQEEWILTDRNGNDETPGIILPGKLPTAFACSSDYAARILYDELQKKGLKVPEDVSLVGYDNYLSGFNAENDLTTYKVDMDKMARCAIKLVTREIADPLLSGVIYEIDSYVIKRNSIRQIK